MYAADVNLRNVVGFVEYRVIKGVQVSTGVFRYACYDGYGV